MYNFCLVLMIAFFSIPSSFADTNEAAEQSCRATMGKIQATQLANLCSDESCTIEMSCREILETNCAQETSDTMEQNRCATKIFVEKIEGQTAHDQCEKFSNGDDQAYYACRQNFYNGFEI